MIKLLILINWIMKWNDSGHDLDYELELIRLWIEMNWIRQELVTALE